MCLQSLIKREYSSIGYSQVVHIYSFIFQTILLVAHPSLLSDDRLVAIFQPETTAAIQSILFEIITGQRAEWLCEE